MQHGNRKNRRGSAYAQNPTAATFERPSRWLAKIFGNFPRLPCGVSSEPSSVNSKHAFGKAAMPASTST